MVCIYCGQSTSVINSRPQKRLRQTWRRRACANCGAIFTTHEVIELESSIAVKHNDGSLGAFRRDKLLISVYKAMGHREKPIDDAGAIAATITSKLLDISKTAAIEAADISNVAFQVLKRFDNAAAVQYAAYHRGTKSKSL
jgi:transcriptional regulator NrdR family protein